MPRPSRALELRVRQRAAGRCEYCRFPEQASDLPFHIDHVIAAKHRGLTTAENLVWACFSCNMHKGSNIAGIDPVTNQVTRLFRPQRDDWTDHFHWQDAWLHGLTDIGRTTILVLEINDPEAVLIRQSLMAEGLM